MTKEDILKLYGKHIYAIRLEIAMRIFMEIGSTETAWRKADEFVNDMLSEEHTTIKMR
jgi:hypothetical protein